MSDYKDELRKKAQVILDYHKNNLDNVIVAYITDTSFTHMRQGNESDIRMNFKVEIITKTNKFVCDEVVSNNPYVVSTLQSVSKKESNPAVL